MAPESPTWGGGRGCFWYIYIPGSVPSDLLAGGTNCCCDIRQTDGNVGVAKIPFTLGRFLSKIVSENLCTAFFCNLSAVV